MKTSSRLISQLTSFLILFACLAGPGLCQAGSIVGWGRNDVGQLPGTNAIGDFRFVSAASQHTLAIRNDGTLQVWGYAPSGIATNTSLNLAGLTSVAAGIIWDVALKADGRLLAVGGNEIVNHSNITAIASGVYHWLAVKTDGTVVGGGTSASSATPPPSGLAAVTAVAAGYEFSLALKANGKVVGWGSNTYGESTVPVGLSNVVAIAAGFRHGLALKNNGMVVAWGNNIYGQCNVPDDLSNVVAIAAGYWHNLALKSDGTVVAWGNLSSGLAVPSGLSRVTAIAAGESHGVALTLQGPIDIDQNPANQAVLPGSNVVFSVVATGQEPLNYQWFQGTNALVNGAGVAGVNSSTLFLNGVNEASEGTYQVVISNAFGTATSASASLTLLRPPTIIYRTPDLTVRAGTNVTLLVSVLGTTPFGYQWSFNGTNLARTLSYLILTNLQPSASGIYTVTVTNLGGSASTNISVVVLDSAPYITRQPYQMLNQTIVSNLTVAPGGTASWSVDARGSLPLTYQWRLNGVDLDGATNSSLTLNNLTVGQSGFYNVIVRNAFGEAISAKVLLNVSQVYVYGSGPATNAPFGLTDVIALAAGNTHVLALKSDRSLVAWGGTRIGVSSPTNIPTAATNVIDIAANNEISMALRGDSRVVVWGDNPTMTNVPAAASNIMSIACGGYHCLALNTNGAVIAWGSSSYGVTTIPPALSNNVVAIAAGTYFSAALKTDGRVVVWGTSSYGITNAPAGLSNVIAIAAGYDHMLALKSDGRVVAWGNNYYGQTNVPAYSYSRTNTLLTNVVAIAAGNGLSLALTADGALISWGNISSVGLKGQIPTNIVAMAASKGQQYPLFVVTASGNGTPFVTLNPATQNTSKGGTVQLYARAVGVQPMRYQWQLNGSEIYSGTNGDLTITNFQALNAGVYHVTASNRLGVATSRDAWVKIPYLGSLATALNFTNVNWSTYSSTSKVDGVWFPQNVEMHDGDAAAQSGHIRDSQKSTLQTSITGPGTLTFWWKVSSEEGYDFLSFIVDGSAIPTARIDGEIDWHQMSCVLTSGTHTVTWVYSKDGSVSSGRDAGWVDQVAFVPASPTITVQPIGRVAALGDSLYVEIQASGGSPLNYQWMKDGVEIPGATGGSHVLTNVSRCDSGAYSARVWNSGGSVISSNAVVRVRVPQRLTAPTRLPGGGWHWSSMDMNGGSLAQSDLDGFEAQMSTNLTDWIPLPNALSITNGALQFEDPDANFPQRFYRVIER